MVRLDLWKCLLKKEFWAGLWSQRGWGDSAWQSLAHRKKREKKQYRLVLHGRLVDNNVSSLISCVFRGQFMEKILFFFFFLVSGKSLGSPNLSWNKIGDICGPLTGKLSSRPPSKKERNEQKPNNSNSNDNSQATTETKRRFCSFSSAETS